MNADETNKGVNQEFSLDETALPFLEYWRIIRKRLWLIILVTGLVVGGALIYLFNQPKIYRAEVTLEIRTNTPHVLGDIEPVIDPIDGARYFSTQEYFETQYLIIGSRAVASQVVTNRQLAEDLGFLGLEGITDPDELAAALESADPVAHLMGLTTVHPIPESHVVGIAVEHHDPAMAALLADSIAEVYVTRNEERQLQGTNEAFEWLANERTELRNRVEDAEANLLVFRDDHNIHAASLQSRQQHMSDLLASINTRLLDIDTEVSAIRSERRQIRDARENGDPTTVPIPSVIDNPLIQALKEQREQMVDELARLETRYGERHHEVEGLNSSLEEVNTAIGREVDNILNSYEVQMSRAQARQSHLVEERQNVLGQMSALSQAEPGYNQLRRNIELSADILTMIERRYKETDLYRRQYDVSNIEVLDAAVCSTNPIRPRKKVFTAVSGVLGLLLGLGFAFLLEFTDNTVRTQEDVEENLGFTFLGVIPSIKRTRAGTYVEAGNTKNSAKSRDLFIHGRPKSSVAECCRSIRTNLHFMSPDRPLKTILVTSAGPREGKTATAINLATVMAQSDNRVLIVDTDMRRPRVHKAFGLSGRIGLTNLILGEADYDEVLTKTEVPNLDILACGSIPPNPTELMHTERFRVITQALTDRYDRVIFDSPPVIAVADAMILGNAVDGVVFVIKTGQTTIDIVGRARNLLLGTNAKILGAVLNDLDLEDRAYRYHYYYSYYYRYGQYYQSESSPGENENEPANVRQS